MLKFYILGGDLYGLEFTSFPGKLHVKVSNIILIYLYLNYGYSIYGNYVEKVCYFIFLLGWLCYKFCMVIIMWAPYIRSFPSKSNEGAHGMGFEWVVGPWGIYSKL